MLKEKVAEYGAKYGMDMYSTEELLSILTGIDPEAFDHDAVSSLTTIGGVPHFEKTPAKTKYLKLCALKKVLNLVSRCNRGKVDVIHGPQDVADMLMPHYSYENKEHFGVVLLNTKNHVLAIREVSVGSLSATVVHPREVFEQAIAVHAASMILFHNHPSGDPDPSREDIALTQRLHKAGNIMDIPVLDHVILGNNNFISLKERNLLEE